MDEIFERNRVRDLLDAVESLDAPIGVCEGRRRADTLHLTFVSEKEAPKERAQC